MRAALTRWRQLSGAQKKQLVLLAMALPAAGASLRLLGYRRTASACQRMAGQRPVRPATAQDLLDAESLAQLANIAGRRGPLPATCLRQALVLHAWLRRRGLDAKLKIGVQKAAGTVDAHAWVELEGIALAQPNLTHRPFPQ
jgi:hypothetical protein